MSRFEESKIIEHDSRLDRIDGEINSLRKAKEEPAEEMTRIKVIAVEFNKDLYKSGEEQINKNLANGYKIQKEFQTDSGIVVFMTKWEKPKKNEMSSNG